jgi:hypothetical protein
MNKNFSAVLECAKCGASCEEVNVKIIHTFDPVTKKWNESIREVTGNITTTFVKLPPGAKCLCDRNSSDEHLHRKCNCCGYYWNEGTLEALYEQS